LSQFVIQLLLISISSQPLLIDIPLLVAASIKFPTIFTLDAPYKYMALAILVG
jgi:hypothetical protein